MHIDQILERFDGVKPSGHDSWMARCPAHHDTNPSCQVRHTNDGHILIHCFAGCTTDNILTAIGLDYSDLRNGKSGSKERQIQATYDYDDESGKLLYQVVRYVPKGFSQRRPDGAGGWIWNLQGVRRVIYRLPGVLKGIKAGQTVYIVEGEKDADNLWSAGQCATTNAQGAGKWLPDFAFWFTGARVIVIPDNDEPGRKHAASIAASLANVVVSIKLLELGDINGRHIKDVSDWLAAGGMAADLETMAARMDEWTPPPAPSAIGEADDFNYRLTDTGLAERFVRRWQPELRFCPDRGRWLRWIGSHWKWISEEEAVDLSKEVVSAIYTEASEADDKDTRKELAGFALRSEARQRRQAAVYLASCERRMQSPGSLLDQKPWLLNVQNGTIDLRTGQLRPHDPADMLTIIAPVDYDPAAQSPIWDDFIGTITQHDSTLAVYLQRCTGMSLTGDISSQAFFFLYGLGANGKSTYLNAIRGLLGPYAHQADMEMIMMKDRPRAGASEDLANLYGRRFVVATEVEEGRKLAVNLIKLMTGGENIRCRHLYEREFEFTPSHKLWIAGNHKPVITDTTNSIWRRVKLMPFTATIEHPDADLPSKLSQIYPAILAWAVRGCLDWQHYGLAEPEIVSRETRKYAQEMDPLGEFMEDCCIIDQSAMVSRAEFYARYESWCIASKDLPLKQRSVSARMKEKGFGEHKNHGIRGWTGLRLRTTDDPEGKICEKPMFFTNGADGADIQDSALSLREVQKQLENHSTLPNNCPMCPPNAPICPENDNFKNLINHPTLNKFNNDGLLDIIFGMPKTAIIDLWKATGAHEIRLNVSSTIMDLPRYLDGQISQEGIDAIKRWIRKVK